MYLNISYIHTKKALRIINIHFNIKKHRLLGVLENIYTFALDSIFNIY